MASSLSTFSSLHPDLTCEREVGIIQQAPNPLLACLVAMDHPETPFCLVYLAVECRAHCHCLAYMCDRRAVGLLSGSPSRKGPCRQSVQWSASCACEAAGDKGFATR